MADIVSSLVHLNTVLKMLYYVFAYSFSSI